MEQSRKTPVLECLEMTFEEFDSGIIALDGETILTGPELEPWRQETLLLDGLQLQILAQGGDNTYSARAPADFISLVVTLPCPEPSWMLGVQLRHNRMGLMRPGETVFAFSEAGSCCCVLTLSIDQCIRSCEEHNPYLAEQLLTGPAVIEISKMRWQQVVTLTNHVRRVAKSDKFFINRAAQVAVAEELIHTFLGAAASQIPNTEHIGRPRSPRKPVVAGVCEYMKTVKSDPGSVAEMAKYVDMPERTLRSVVQEMLGVTPKKLLKIKKLNDIHQALRQESGPRTVTEIAFEYGEWEMGRFARNYYDLFNEYPSATLATS